ncbi:PepSY-like domain-containing protein [Aquirufa regiilacus]|uniref:PepSY-like domain-containing protein n=1 Tax=Aquirufa regiilacus TaxID=3024868 RepID=A0ABU3TPF2_9BACT|nr:PepSY-like domain-containing protein [Aquirufa sp. LEOWEIH-7C]MDU0807743.1 PepSY-like domain-containing protein [Aquirufa sp. LEOWEIH-7C]
MKKLILFAFASTVLISSCSKEEAMNLEGFTAINAANIPQAVQSTIQQSFPTAKVAYSVIQPNALYVADVTTATAETQIVLTSKGAIKEAFSKIDSTALPASVLTYLATNFPGYDLLHASQKTTGTPTGYRVELKYKTEFYSVLFDDKGAYVSQTTGMPGGPKGGKEKGSHGPAVTNLALTDLPVAVQTALTDYTFQRATAKIDSQGITIYHVHVEKSGVSYELTIDASGKVISSKEIPTKPVITKTDLSALPAAITSYLNTNAVGWTLKNAVSIAADNVTIHYHVLVSVAGAVQTYMFDKDFNLVQNAGKGPKDNPSLPNFTVAEITQAQIPAAAITYLNTNYAGWTFNKAQSVTADATVKEIEVYISLAGKNYKVEFDGNGVFLGAKLK